MASPTRQSAREEERRLSIRTLLIASVASAAAAIITSQFWKGGTPIAAAVTPVIVALVSELLHKPTEVIAQRFTTEGTAVLPEAGGPAPPPPQTADRLPERAPPEPGSGQVKVYRRPASRRRKIAVGVVVTTAVLAFAIAAAALTIPELVTGGSIGKGGGDTTLFGGRDRKEMEEPEQPNVPTAPQEQPTEPERPQPTETETVPTETETVPTETETTPTERP